MKNGFLVSYHGLAVFLVAQVVKNLLAMQGTLLWSLDWEDPLEKGIATHSSILAGRTPWTEEPGGLQSVWLGLPKCRTRLKRLSTHARVSGTWACTSRAGERVAGGFSVPQGLKVPHAPGMARRPVSLEHGKAGRRRASRAGRGQESES